MQCKLCEDKLLEFIYGELDEEDRLRMERHLQESAPCREKCREFQSVREAAAEDPEEEPPVGLNTRILAHAGEIREKKRRRSLRSWLFHPLPATLAVVAVAAIVYIHSIRMEGDLPLYKESRVTLDTYGKLPADSAGVTESPELLMEYLGSEEREPVPAPPRPAMLAKEEGERKASPAETGKRVSMAKLRSKRMPEKASPSAGENVPLGTGQSSSFQSGDKARARSGSPEEPSPWKGHHPAREEADEETMMAARAPAISGNGTGRISRAAPVPIGETPRDRFRMEDPEYPLTRVEQLTNADRCQEALAWLHIYLARGPEEKKTGPAWMQLAQCYQRHGDLKQARDAARQARTIPTVEEEAEAFLLELTPPAK